MVANYLHGPETIEVENGIRPVKTVKSVVISLIDTAPMGDVDTLVQYLSERDVTVSGSQFIGLIIPQALDAICDHDTDTVLVINVLDPAKHKAAIRDGVVTFSKSTGQTRLMHPVVANVVAKNSEDSTTHAANTNYRVDAQAGILTNPSKAIEIGGSVEVSYEHVDPSKVTAADIIGGVNSAGNRTGMKLLDDSFDLYGYFAKILIVLVLRTRKSVAVELIAAAEELGTMTCTGTPVGTTFVQILASRGPGGIINFSTSSDRVRPCYPHVKVYDPVTNIERPEPLNQCAAGLCTRVGPDRGYWWSSSNQEILGITGVERQLSVMIDDPQSEVNLPNKQGITTAPSSYSSGLRLRGNRTATWPTVIHMRNFKSVHRAGDVINESVRYFGQQYIDMPITQTLIDTLTESVSAYGRKMTNNGAVLGFHCWPDPARNPETELAARHLLLNHRYTPLPPLKQLTFEVGITLEYLLTLKGGNQCQKLR